MPNSTRCQRASSTLVAVLLSCSLTVVAQTTPPASTTAPFDTLRWQAEEEIRQTQDPELGRVPYERLDQARAELAARQQYVTEAICCPHSAHKQVITRINSQMQVCW